MNINHCVVTLATIRKLQFATRRHVISIHDMGGIRNVKRIMRDLKPYVSKTMPGGPVLPIRLSVTGCSCSTR
ncbi:hypothetical protein [Bacillus thuringiensis]|uniref:hypothetical protein n=1 Tax=Bacillus thuringiensis TaxID=1428 RepID=UPI003CC80A1B